MPIFCTLGRTFAPVKSFSKVGRRAQIGRKTAYEIDPRFQRLLWEIMIIPLWVKQISLRKVHKFTYLLF